MKNCKRPYPKPHAELKLSLSKYDLLSDISISLDKISSGDFEINSLVKNRGYFQLQLQQVVVRLFQSRLHEAYRNFLGATLCRNVITYPYSQGEGLLIMIAYIWE